MQKITIIGAGNMGLAIYQALNRHGFKGQVNICDVNAGKLHGLANAHLDVNKAISKAGTVILAVKPQSFLALAQTTNDKLKDKLLISIMAGVNIKTIAKLTKANKIIRSMPNLALKVGCGLTGWVASAKVSGAEKKLAEKIFSAFGNQIELKKESALNFITALSGSGPAYFFYLTELMQNKAISLGFAPKNAQLIAEVTLLGAANLLYAGKQTAGQWRAAVTSKGGTTQAALKYLKNKKFDKIFFGAIDAAKKRSEELSK